MFCFFRPNRPESNPAATRQRSAQPAGCTGLPLATVEFATVFLATVLLAVGTTGALVAEETVGNELFVDRIDVNLVNVEVFVTDRQGNRVTGLRAEDFRLEADGEPVPISNFYAIDRRGYPGEPAGAITLPGAPDQTLELSELPADQQLHLLVYVDNYNLRGGSRNRVLKQMSDFLDQRLAFGDQVMLVSFNRSLDILTPFTTNRAQIAEAVETLRRTVGYRDMVEGERRNLLSDIAEYATPPPGGLGGALAARSPEEGYNDAIDAVRAFGQKLQEDFEQSARGLRSSTQLLAGLPGRKAMLYVSDGLTERPTEELYEHVTRVFGEILDTRTTALQQPNELSDNFRPATFQRIVADATANQVTLYTLDARGTTGGSTLSAEYQTFGGEGGGMADLDAVRSANLVAPMIHLAERTGGQAIRNTTNFDDALARIGQDFTSFYSLGFHSPFTDKDTLRRIRVRVDRPGVQVRHRTGYVDKPVGDRIADRTLSSLLVDEAPNPLGLNLDFGPEESTSRRRTVVPLIVRVPARNITFIPQDDRFLAQLTLFVAVRDEASGGLSNVERKTFQPSFGQEELEAFLNTGELALRTNLQLSKGEPLVVVGVWDEMSGVESFARQLLSSPETTLAQGDL